MYHNPTSPPHAPRSKFFLVIFFPPPPPKKMEAIKNEREKNGEFLQPFFFGLKEIRESLETEAKVPYYVNLYTLIIQSSKINFLIKFIQAFQNKLYHLSLE